MKTKKQLIKECLELARKNIPPAPKHLEISLAKGGGACPSLSGKSRNCLDRYMSYGHLFK